MLLIYHTLFQLLCNSVVFFNSSLSYQHWQLKIFHNSVKVRKKMKLEIRWNFSYKKWICQYLRKTSPGRKTWFLGRRCRCFLKHERHWGHMTINWFSHKIFLSLKFKFKYLGIDLTYCFDELLKWKNCIFVPILKILEILVHLFIIKLYPSEILT